jgi:hypothetical protein
MNGHRGGILVWTVVLAVAGIPAGAAAQDPAPARPRLEIEGRLNPTQVSTRLITQLAGGHWPLERFVDRTHGLVEIRYETEFLGEEQGTRLLSTVKTSCGRELDRRLPALRSELQKRLRIGGQPPVCHLLPVALPGRTATDAAGNTYFAAGPECLVLGDHDTPTLYFLFLPGADGLQLRAVLRLQEAARDLGWLSQAHRYAASQLAASVHRKCSP